MRRNTNLLLHVAETMKLEMVERLTDCKTKNFAVGEETPRQPSLNGRA